MLCLCEKQANNKAGERKEHETEEQWLVKEIEEQWLVKETGTMKRVNESR